MGADEKPKGNAVLKILGAVFAIVAVGFGVIGVMDLISAEGNILDSIIPDGMKNIFAYVELGAALLFLVISIVIFSTSNKPKKVDEDDISDFENNVFNFKENKKEEVSKRYEQPKDEFPEEVSDEYKQYMDAKDDSDRYLSKEDIGKDRAARPIFTPKADDEYINQMGDDFEEFSENNTPAELAAVPELSETTKQDVTFELDDNDIADETEEVVSDNNYKYESSTESVQTDIDSNSIDLSGLQNAAVDTTVYETETLDTGDIDTSALQVNNSVSNEYEHEIININSIDFSALEGNISSTTVYEYDEVDTNAIDISGLESAPTMDTSGYFTDEINSDDVNSLQLEDAKPSFTYAYEETESISLNSADVNTPADYDTADSMDVFDVNIYEDNTEPKAPKVYDFAKKAAELAASKAAADEGKSESHTSSYLNTYLESFASKPSTNTLYGASTDNSNQNNYNPVYDDEDSNTDLTYDTTAEQVSASESSAETQKSNLDSLLDSFTFGKK